MKRRALITGALGQDGTFLAEFLTGKGYEVYGIARAASTVHPRFYDWPATAILFLQNVLDLSGLQRVISEVRPDEIYHLAAESQVARSFREPLHAFDVIARGTLNLLEAVRHSGYNSKIYIASTSEMFGGMSKEPCNEKTPFHPRSPYGCAKLAAHSLAVNYRESYRMFICCGLLFNHESERRGEEFVTRKITKGVARILAGEDVRPIRLGNLKASRDWGYAPDYVRGMWLMLQQSEPDDYVLATGETRDIQAFLNFAWEPPNSHIVEIDPSLYRPAEVNVLIGDATKAREVLGWKPETTFKDMVYRMVQHDLRLEKLRTEGLNGAISVAARQ